MGGAKRVCIVGAGSSGLTSARQMLDEGLDVVIYEKSAVLGGLWAYHEQDIFGQPSVMRSTIINTSKEMSAFSDFPPPKEFPNYMHNTYMHRYFESYADNFNLRSRVRFNHELVEAAQAEDYEESGRWNVLVRDTQGGVERRETFDAIMVCVGHHVYPHVPTFPGQEKFRGKIVHTHSLKVPDEFKGKRVAVVGIGNSGVDAAVEASTVTSTVYLSTRRGAWIIRRVGPNGIPMDVFLSTRLNNYIKNIIPESAANGYVEDLLNSTFNHKAYGLQPKHRFGSQHPTINDALPNKILSGVIQVKKDIKEFTADGVLFDGDTEVTELDVVILATGYQIKFPFLPKDVISVQNNQVQLYKNMFPPNLRHPTLSIIGLIQPIGAIFPIAEMQARWQAQLLSGKKHLPPVDEIFREIDAKQEVLKKRYVLSPRHTIQVDFIDYMDEIADQIGAKPTLMKYFFSDPQLFWQLLRGPCLPYQYRLEGPHLWKGARDAIIKAPSRIMSPLNKSTHWFTKGSNLAILYFFIVLLILAYVAF
ncbi:flavin-containing monooxygenase 5-like [Ornithodoros turicata]|uniref:flavin-containing monooxygenase 5-like n=1 Tax=Ornithodoros turicata TaxID=34597 RepID=UPI0031386A94